MANNNDNGRYHNTNTFVFHGSWMNVLQYIKVKDRLRFITMVNNYGCFGIEPTEADAKINEGMWNMIKNEIDFEQNKRDEQIEKKREANRQRYQKKQKADNPENTKNSASLSSLSQFSHYDNANADANAAADVTANVTAINSLTDNLSNQNNIPPKKSPQGDVCEESSSSVQTKKLSKQIREALSRCKTTWRTALKEGGKDGEAQKYRHYLPYLLTRLCKDSKNVTTINTNQKIPRVSDSTLTMMTSFFEFHVLDFVVSSGLRYKMTPEDFSTMAQDMKEQFHDLNIGQVALFFYLLLHPDHRIRTLKWNGSIDRLKVNDAMNAYLEWIENAS